MQEKIGNVTLDLTHWPGKDLYSDGDIEDEILSLVWNVIDYEWTFDFPLPMKYIKYRSLLYMFHNQSRTLFSPIIQDMKILKSTEMKQITFFLSK